MHWLIYFYLFVHVKGIRDCRTMPATRGESKSKSTAKKKKRETKEDVGVEQQVDYTTNNKTNGALVAARVDDGRTTKRQKLGSALAIASDTQQPPRTSGLMAPTMLLTGHGDQVFCVRFHPGDQGDVLASGSHDKKIFLWRTYGECENYSVLSGHKNAVLQLQWVPDGQHIVSCSPDMTVREWDAVVGEQVSVMKDHSAIVNCCAMTQRGTPMVASGSDDGTVKLWDMRSKRASKSFSQGRPVTAVDMSEDGDVVYCGGIEGVVHAWDVRKDAVAMELHGHLDTITGMEVSPSGSHILTNSMDNTMRSWDIRPYAPDNRCVRVFSGHQHGFEKNLLRCSWSPDGKLVSGGSSDRIVHVWNVATGELTYSLPGHDGTVNDVAFHPTEPILVSASSDKTLYLGELV